MAQTRLLFVDDDDALRTALGAVLTHHGFLLTSVSSVREALELISTRDFDVLLSDLNIGEPGDGFTVVSAMRRVQPDACTFILTGYPDLETAIQGIRNQVDDYFSKPLHIDRLVDAISHVRNGKKPADKALPTRKVAQIIKELSPLICKRWLQQVMADPELAAIPLTEEQRSDHVPDMVEELIRRLEGPQEELSDIATEAARKHGKLRYQQGYTIPQIIFEARVLQHVLTAVIHENLFGLDLSTLVGDILEIGETLQADVEISIRVYQAQIPRSLQSSFSMLYRSPYLGVAIADERRIIDGNDAFLRMIRRTREQLQAGDVDWRAITPEKFRQLDENAMEQLREFGTCVPFEKEFVLPDGSSEPFLIGAVRLSAEPFQWSSYVVEMSEQRKLQAAEEKVRAWEARYGLINHLAHELNNPLAAMTFTLHLLNTHPDLSDDTRHLVKDATEMLDRVAATVRRVLAEVKQV
jgi:ActR/RegA family two-component response regulator/signal transduction histidine kinase